MFNRIRRTLSITKGGHAFKGRHRRPEALTRLAGGTSVAAPAHAPRANQDSDGDSGRHRYALAGEDSALVRPYVLAAWEKHTQPRSLFVAPHLSASAWSSLTGAS
ncbi:hypothetical protein [Streptomyces sp. AM 2-1-1]|uniref:hypothetical protein n=1 Tax=Streptomyces sp. AM 2-1-1 TaxID=3028709 RepID=UPI0023B97ECD|nr:hypothetical protein [Streptomyces sp. AM 2-1-1]WEH41771.1 hypothetical protein PZB77_20985 [Streptomyces sp. AM 2-1-1]